MSVTHMHHTMLRRDTELMNTHAAMTSSRSYILKDYLIFVSSYFIYKYTIFLSSSPSDGILIYNMNQSGAHSVKAGFAPKML